jgi:hypothetical protein
MLLVPRQLLRVGMTGDVPYYGGRLTPAQAYAASHPVRPPPPMPMAARAPVPERGARSGSEGHRGSDTQLALQHLLATGVITESEFEALQARVAK